LKEVWGKNVDNEMILRKMEEMEAILAVVQPTSLSSKSSEFLLE
jgi:hypothetical protein